VSRAGLAAKLSLLVGCVSFGGRVWVVGRVVGVRAGAVGGLRIA
jgi:hypothetical protein